MICTGCCIPFSLQGDKSLSWNKKLESATEGWVKILAFSSCVTLGKSLNLIHKIGHTA